MIRSFLPDNILSHFTLTEVHELCELKLKREVLHINLEEKNELPSKYSKLACESKGFYLAKTIQDSPIKGKAKQRFEQWISKSKKHEIKEFNIAANSIEYHLENILNFFNNRAINANAESFNSKIKLFRANLRGVTV